jgi:hypothetical protein
MHGKRVSWRIVGVTLVCAHSEEAPSDAEWDEVMDVMSKLPHPERTRVLVFTYGGAPNSLQRQTLNEIVKNKKLPVAVLTHSLLAKGAGTALRWFNPFFRVFDPEDIDKALDHLDIPAGTRRLVTDTLAELKRDVTRGGAQSA